MRIQKLDIKNFGKLNNFSIDLKEGLNIIYGANESGKSTIQSFISAMFYGLKGGRSSKDGDLPPLKKFKPWSSNEYGGAIEYTLGDGDKIRVERNFANNNVKIYDSLYNDITDNFETGRDRGVLFAEKQLGINEVCFEKTLLIRQMETRVGNDGSKELVSRLTNASQSGFDDISVTRAKEALREALKNNVGTDRSSTRPLDKILARLNELSILKKDLTQKRNDAIEVEKKLSEETEQKDRLERKSILLSKFKEILKVKIKLDEKSKLKEVLTDIIDNISMDEAKKKSISQKLEEFNKIKNDFTDFSTYGDEDVDEISSEFQSLSMLLEENKKIDIEIENKKEEMSDIEIGIADIRLFGDFDAGIENTIPKLNQDILNLENEKKNSEIESINDRLKKAERIQRLINIAIAACSLAVLMILLYAYYYKVKIYVFCTMPAVLAVVLMYFNKRLKRKNIDLSNQKKMSFISINGAIDEITKKQKRLEEIYIMVGAKNIEEFFSLKAKYENSINIIVRLNNEINILESELGANIQRINVLKNSIYEKLYTSGIYDGNIDEIDIEKINDFKCSVRRYKGVEPNVKYIVESLKELNSDIKEQYIKASALAGLKCESLTDLNSFINEIALSIENMRKEILVSVCDAKELFLSSNIANEDFGQIEKKYLENEIEHCSRNIDSDYSKLTQDINANLLRIKEYETILKNICDDDDIQKIEEEIEDLKTKKCNLEDIGISLKIAMDVLGEASMEIQRGFAPMLNDKMGEIISKISCGKYSDLRAADNLSLKVLVPETSGVASALELSSGTIDQIYFSLRLAMVDLLISSKASVLPLIMDEFLAHYDDYRTMETIRFLKELSMSRQIILFTCKKRELEMVYEVFGESANVIEI